MMSLASDAGGKGRRVHREIPRHSRNSGPHVIPSGDPPMDFHLFL